jgi:ATP-dependent Clp protease ATP-binding subunit ClpB
VDFKNTVVLMTSNIGSQHLLHGLNAASEERVMGELKAHFRPELLNRLDDVIMFSALGKEQIEKIVDVQLALVSERLQKREIELWVAPEAKQKLAEEGYDPLYGARPLKRLIQREIVDRVARAVLEGKLQKGGVARITTEKGELTLDTSGVVGATQARATA